MRNKRQVENKERRIIMADSTQFKRHGLGDNHLFSNVIRYKLQGAKGFLDISGLRIKMKINMRFAVTQMLRMIPADIRERLQSPWVRIMKGKRWSK